MILRWISGRLVVQYNAVYMSAYFCEVLSDSHPVCRVNAMLQVVNPIFHRQKAIIALFYKTY